MFNLGKQTCSRCHDLEKELDALKTANTESSQLTELLRKEVNELQEEIKKSKNFVCRKYQLCILKRFSSY